ncbi:MAG: PEP-CTERM sorting domain-containing protein [Phycisphaerae bacterium]|jgi:hypothetical protein
MKRLLDVIALGCTLLLVLATPAWGQTAVGLTGGTQAPMGATTNHGWRFTANEAITVTELGLWDDDNDGMDIDHPIGLWEFSSGTLLTSGIIHAGTGDELFDHFRYVDVDDVLLQVGGDYVVGFYTHTSNDDKMVYASPTDLWVDPAINYIEARYGGNGSLLMPGPSTSTTYYRFGPNFKFIPEPATAGLLLIGGLWLLRRR